MKEPFGHGQIDCQPGLHPASIEVHQLGAWPARELVAVVMFELEAGASSWPKRKGHVVRAVVINSGHTFGEADFRGTNAWLYPRLGEHS